MSASARRAHAVALAAATAALALSLRASPALALSLGVLAVLAPLGSRIEWTSPPRRLVSLAARSASSPSTPRCSRPWPAPRSSSQP